MAILLYNGDFGTDSWFRALKQRSPNETIYCYPDVPNKDEVEFAAIWDLPEGGLATYPNLRAVLLLGAGGDFLMRESSLPDVPIVRLVDEIVIKDMSQYCLYWVAHYYRNFDIYARQQQVHIWRRIEYPPIDQFKVGVIGFGSIGSQIGYELSDIGYDVSAWVQSDRQSEKIRIYKGVEEFSGFMSNLDVLINLLPLTTETHSFLNHERLSLLPSHAKVINMSRGAVIDEDALAALLDADKLGGAVLDVFATEPLAQNHWAWSHPKVQVTPHSSGQTYPRSAVKSLVDNIARIRAGEQPYPIFDPARGY